MGKPNYIIIRLILLYLKLNQIFTAVYFFKNNLTNKKKKENTVQIT